MFLRKPKLVTPLFTCEPLMRNRYCMSFPSFISNPTKRSIPPLARSNKNQDPALSSSIFPRSCLIGLNFQKGIKFWQDKILDRCKSSSSSALNVRLLGGKVLQLGIDSILIKLQKKGRVEHLLLIKWTPAASEVFTNIRKIKFKKKLERRN